MIRILKYGLSLMLFVLPLTLLSQVNSTLDGYDPLKLSAYLGRSKSEVIKQLPAGYHSQDSFTLSYTSMFTDELSKEVYPVVTECLFDKDNTLTALRFIHPLSEKRLKETRKRFNRHCALKLSNHLWLLKKENGNKPFEYEVRLKVRKAQNQFVLQKALAEEHYFNNFP